MGVECGTTVKGGLEGFLTDVVAVVVVGVVVVVMGTTFHAGKAA